MLHPHFTQVTFQCKWLVYRKFRRLIGFLPPFQKVNLLHVLHAPNTNNLCKIFRNYVQEVRKFVSLHASPFCLFKNCLLFELLTNSFIMRIQCQSNTKM